MTVSLGIWANMVNLEARLKAWGVQLIATAQDFGSSNEAKIMRALMWSLSEYYIDNLASETKKGLREVALKGLHTGGYPPFGYDIDNQRYKVNELEAGYVRKMFDAAQSGEGFGALVQQMKAAGIWRQARAAHPLPSNLRDFAQ